MLSKDSFFDNHAKNWENRCYPPAVRTRLLGLIPQFGVKAGERLLDVGTGPGVLIPYLCKEVGRSGQVCALDLSFEMARQAKLKPRPQQDLVVQSDVHYLPFKTGRFDRVICFAAFPHFADPVLTLKEMARVLRVGGTLVIAHLMSRHELAAHHASHSQVAGDVLPEDAKLAGFFQQAGLILLGIVDQPGCFLAKGTRPAT